MKHPDEFHHQSVRDLAWAISSPPLLTQPSGPGCWPDSNWYQQIYEATLPWINSVDRDPSELEALIAEQKDRRLGKYFETLWYYWLSNHPRYQIVESNLQIIIDGQTLGELDFIVFDRETGQTMHWEVAVKFYLGTGDTRVMSNWHGPNLRDRLDIKFDHLLKRQSVISQDTKVSQWLKQRGIVIDQYSVILKGRLYYPWKYREQVQQGHALSVAISPLQCCSKHLNGIWLTDVELGDAFDDVPYFIPLIKTGWLEKISTPSVKKFVSKNDIYETVSNKIWRLPLHVQCANPCHSWDRAFITAAGWPTKVV